MMGVPIIHPYRYFNESLTDAVKGSPGHQGAAAAAAAVMRMRNQPAISIAISILFPLTRQWRSIIDCNIEREARFANNWCTPTAGLSISTVTNPAAHRSTTLRFYFSTPLSLSLSLPDRNIKFILFIFYAVFIFILIFVSFYFYFIFCLVTHSI